MKQAFENYKAAIAEAEPGKTVVLLLRASRDSNISYAEMIDLADIAYPEIKKEKGGCIYGGRC